jgi:hypothetical protein
MMPNILSKTLSDPILSRSFSSAAGNIYNHIYHVVQQIQLYILQKQILFPTAKLVTNKRVNKHAVIFVMDGCKITLLADNNTIKH